MKVLQRQHNLRHGSAVVKGAACLLLLAGSVTSQVQAANENMGVTSTISMQQNDIVKKGVILDATGEPIIGASVVEKGNPTNGTITDIDGNYSLKVKNAKSVLVVSYTGFMSQETEGGQLVLREDLKALSEVVVIGYGTQRKGDVTSAVSSVKAEDFAAGKIGDAAELVKGKIAGLSITNSSGDPTAQSTIMLRGVNTISGNVSPLVLVDGIEGDLNTVAPENIASIDVLKDASAAAIYRTRAPNGVILITTKTGKSERTARDTYSN